MLLLGEEGWSFILQLTWMQSHQWENNPFPGQPAPQDSTYTRGTHHGWQRLGSSP